MSDSSAVNIVTLLSDNLILHPTRSITIPSSNNAAINVCTVQNMRQMSGKKGVVTVNLRLIADDQTRCIPELGSPLSPSSPSKCSSCTRSNTECTFLKGYKKAGRRSRVENEARSMRQSTSASAEAGRPPTPPAWSPPFGAATTSAVTTDEPVAPVFLCATAPLPPALPTPDLFTGLVDVFAGSSGSQYPGASLSPAAPMVETSPVAAASTVGASRAPVYTADTQIEDVAPWETVNFFITLWLRYCHSLSPLAHKPSFSQLITMREDREDRNLRAFILGVGGYICKACQS